jgi:GGDEF domain-containing protein
MAIRAYGMRRLSWRIWWARRSGRPELLVAFIDVDGLSRVDQVFGRPAATREVRAVGRQLRAQLGAPPLIFRYGGDEYVCALATSSFAELEDMLTSARRNLIGSRRRGFTAGIAQLRPEDGAYRVVKRAELHMFGAKESPGVTVTGSLLPANREASA